MTQERTGPKGKWAEPVDRLALSGVPKEAINLNVEGRRLTGPVHGFGQLWQRTYTVHLAGASVTPAEVIAVWKQSFASFWPPGSHFYGPAGPLDAGAVALLNLAGPGGLKIATGLEVIYADDLSFCFMSAAGHMFGGLITFNAYEEDGATVAQIQALLRSSNPLYDVTLRLGLTTRAEDEFWQGALANLAARFGVAGQPVRVQALLLDPAIQWSRAGNIWYNSAVRTVLYMPLRWVRGLLGR